MQLGKSYSARRNAPNLTYEHHEIGRLKFKHADYHVNNRIIVITIQFVLNNIIFSFSWKSVYYQVNKKIQDTSLSCNAIVFEISGHKVENRWCPGGNPRRMAILLIYSTIFFTGTNKLNRLNYSGFLEFGKFRLENSFFKFLFLIVIEFICLHGC